MLSVSIGQTATLYLDAIAGTHFTGIVTEIDPYGANSGGNTKYTIIVAVPRTDYMLAGMNATIVLAGPQSEQRPLIPLAALNENGNVVTVYTAYDPETDTLLSPVTVTIGCSDGTNAELLSGLSAGDAYYYRYAESIAYQTE